MAIHPEDGRIEASSFATREAAAAIEWLSSRNAAGLNIYWTVNPVMQPLAKKPAREDIAAMEWLHVDVDPDKRKPLENERARIARLFGDDWPADIPRASVVVDSGGGYQAFWRLDGPVQIGGRPEAYADAARYNQQLEVRFGADPCHNVDRIMRLPGTVNWPNAKKRAAGRAPRLATVVQIRDVSYPIARFTAAPPRQIASGGLDAPRVDPPKIQTGNVRRLLSLDELGEKVSGRIKVVINVGHDPDNPNRWPSRSEPLFWVVCELIRAEVSDDMIYSVITDGDFRISESVLEKGTGAERYALQQIQHAHEHVTDPQLAELNDRHAVISDIGGKCRVLSESLDPILKREHFSLQTFEDFGNRYSNRSMEIPAEKGTRSVPLGKWWLQNPLRRQYERLLFAPGQTIPGSYNLWRGFAFEARPGNCEMYLTHLRANICRSDDVLFEYVLSWMARAVQEPGTPGQTALVMRGTRGAGKGVMATTFGALFGRHFLPVTNPGQIVGEFNEHLRDTVVLFADEAFFAGDKRNEAVLKGLVTEAKRMSTAKFQAAEVAANCLHIIMATNSDWVVPAGPHERRFLVLDVGHGNLQDKVFFRAVEEQMLAGGYEALLHLLLTRDLSKFEVRDVPKTAALQEQKEHSLALEDEWWLEKLRSGELREGQGWPEWVACSELLFDFGAYAQRWGRGQRTSSTRLGRLLSRVGAQRKQLGRKVDVVTEDGKVRRVDRPRVYQLPTLADARLAWAHAMGGEFQWSDEVLVDAPTEESFA